jgi:putative heme iron utilization protein
MQLPLRPLGKPASWSIAPASHPPPASSGAKGPMISRRFRKVIEVNLIGSFNMLRLFSDRAAKLDPLADGERGVVISTASVAAFDGQIGQAAYSASKGGVHAMALPIARELARFGIRIMTIAPGIFATPMLMGMPQEVQDSLGASVPFPRALASQRNMPGLPCISLTTSCSMARPSGLTARSEWRRSRPSMKEPVKTIRDTDEEARLLARRLVRGARFAAIGVLEPETGFPFTSRVLTGTDTDGAPVILVSGLSVHTAALLADPRASLLFGEPGKGDPLAHPRITLRTRAVRVPRDDEGHAALRARSFHGTRRPRFMPIFPISHFSAWCPNQPVSMAASARPIVLEASDLVIRSPAIADMAAIEPGAIEHMNERSRRHSRQLCKGFRRIEAQPAGKSVESTVPDWISPTEMSLSASSMMPRSQSAASLRFKLAELSRTLSENRGVH